MPNELPYGSVEGACANEARGAVELELRGLTREDFRRGIKIVYRDQWDAREACVDSLRRLLYGADDGSTHHQRVMEAIAALDRIDKETAPAAVEGPE